LGQITQKNDGPDRAKWKNIIKMQEASNKKQERNEWKELV